MRFPALRLRVEGGWPSSSLALTTGEKPPLRLPVPIPLFHGGVRLTLYRAKERGRQVLPPSFPSATLEIYYADSGGAATAAAGPRRSAPAEEEKLREEHRGLRKFKTLFTLRAPNDFSQPFISFSFYFSFFLSTSSY